jgi:ubiquinone/menaquinone biosynthesis C-methylase UbiE
MEMEDLEVQWFEDHGVQMVAKLGVRAGDTVVDFGCGVGRYSIPLSKAVEAHGTVYAIERGAEDLAELQRRADRFGAPDSLSVIQSDSIQLEAIPSESADFLFAFDVLQYVEDWASLFSTVDRILKPSGLLHIYPAEIPHPDEVDTAKLTALLETLGFEPAAATEYEMMHNKFRIKDRIYTFRRAE